MKNIAQVFFILLAFLCPLSAVEEKVSRVIWYIDGKSTTTDTEDAVIIICLDGKAHKQILLNTVTQKRLEMSIEEFEKLWSVQEKIPAIKSYLEDRKLSEVNTSNHHILSFENLSDEKKSRTYLIPRNKETTELRKWIKSVLGK